jgi:hypothetical protein
VAGAHTLFNATTRRARQLRLRGFAADAGDSAEPHSINENTTNRAPKMASVASPRSKRPDAPPILTPSFFHAFRRPAGGSLVSGSGGSDPLFEFVRDTEAGGDDVPFGSLGEADAAFHALGRVDGG